MTRTTQAYLSGQPVAEHVRKGVAEVDRSELETKTVYQQTFIVNAFCFFFSVAFAIVTGFVNSYLVEPFVHLAANIGVTGTRLVGHASGGLGVTSAVVAAVGVLVCYPLRHTRGRQDASQLIRCANVYTTAALAVSAILLTATGFVINLMFRVASSRVGVGLVKHDNSLGALL